MFRSSPPYSPLSNRLLFQRALYGRPLFAFLNCGLAGGPKRQLGLGRWNGRPQRLNADHGPRAFTRATRGISSPEKREAARLAKGWMAAFYHEPSTLPLFQLMALQFILSAIPGVPQVLLRRQLRIKLLAIADCVSVGVGMSVGVGGAILGWGVWSLVAQTLTMSFTNCPFFSKRA